MGWGRGSQSLGRRWNVRPTPAALLFVAGFIFQSCSSVPDWGNPVHWYDSAFGNEKSTKSSAATAPGPAPDNADKVDKQEKFPTLATVPERPSATSGTERREMQKSLAADRDSAHYTDEELRGRPAAAGSAPVAPPAPSTEPAAPATVAAAQPPASPATQPPAPPPASALPPAAEAPRAASPQPPQAPTTPSEPVPVATPIPVASTPPTPPAINGSSTEDVYAAALQQSAATVTTAPANAGFAPPRGQAVAQFATSVPPIVQQNYNASLAVTPPTLPMAGTPTGGRFGAAGSRLLSTILFANGSAALSQQDRANLRVAVAEYKRRGGSFRVVGYATDVGNKASAEQKLANFDISERRAETVANELIRGGVRADAVFVEARSDASIGGGPASDGRRAEIFLEN